MCLTVSDLNIANFTEKGLIKLSTYLISYRVGDIVDIKANAAQQRGMPHKYYHGCVGLYMRYALLANDTRYGHVN